MSLVTLAPISPEHAPTVQRLASDPAVTATTNLPEPYPDGGAAAWIAYAAPRHAAGLEYVFAILAPTAPTVGGNGPEVLGVCGLVMPERPPADAPAGADGVAEMGYWLGAEYWGRGYATAACRALAAFAFAHTTISAIDAFPLAENRASCRVLEKLGAVLVGIVPNTYPKWAADRLLAHYRLVRAAVDAPPA
ncbi:MAG: GNAT family N-acetyltransferase [Gemmatimonadota bacterium]|jgi:ribosomal-protein-alanine N-acetyltransferase